MSSAQILSAQKLKFFGVTANKDQKKSVLASLMIEHLQTHGDSIAFFHSDYNKNEQQTFIKVIRQVIRQLLCQTERPSLQDLSPYFTRCISQAKSLPF